MPPLGVLVWTTQFLLTTPSFLPHQRRRRRKRRRSVWLMRSGQMDPALERQEGLGPGGLFSWREWVCEVTFLLGPPTPWGWLYRLDQAWGRQLEPHVGTGSSCPHDFPDGPVLQAGGWFAVLVCLPPASQWGECRWRRQISNLTWKPLQMARWPETQGELENIFQTFPPQQDCQTTWMWPDTVVEKDKAVPFWV